MILAHNKSTEVIENVLRRVIELYVHILFVYYHNCVHFLHPNDQYYGFATGANIHCDYPIANTKNNKYN